MFKQSSLINVLFIGILLIGFYLRIKGTLDNTFAFTYDVGRDLLVVRDIIDNLKFPLIGPTTGQQGVFYGPWWYYILIPPFLITQGNPQGINFLFAASGIITVILGFIVGKKIGGVYLGLLFSALLSFSPALIGLATQIWSPNIIPQFILLSFYVACLTLELKNKKSKKLFVYFGLLGFLLGIIIDMEIVFGILLMASFLLFLLLKFNFLSFFRHFLMFGIGLFITIATRVVFEVRHDFIMTRNLPHLFSSNSEKQTFHLQIAERANQFWEIFVNTLGGGNNYTAVVILFASLFLIMGFFRKAKSREKDFLLLGVITILVFFFGSSLFNHAIWGHYLVGIPVFYILLTALTLQFLHQSVSQKFVVYAISIVFLAVVLNPMRIAQNMKSTNFEGDASVYRNQLQVIDYVYKRANTKPFNVTVYTPPVYDYTYQYLFSWYGKKTYKYLPDQKPTKLLFIVLEPDPQFPKRQTDWLIIRENDGKTIEEDRLQGGIVVQTRTRP